MNIQDWFLLGLIGLISLQSKRLSRVFKSISFLVLSLLYGPALIIQNYLLLKIVHWNYIENECVNVILVVILTAGPYNQSYGFLNSHVWMWELDYKETWVPKNWCFWTMVLEKTLESPLDCKEIKPVNPKGNQSWIFIGRTDPETPKFWPPDAKSWLFGKHRGAVKDWRQEEKGTAEDEMVRWHHWLDGHEFEQALGVGDGQGSLECCSPWSHRVRHDWATEPSWVVILGSGTESACSFGFLPGENIRVHNQKVFYFQSSHWLLPWFSQSLPGAIFCAVCYVLFSLLDA